MPTNSITVRDSDTPTNPGPSLVFKDKSGTVTTPDDIPVWASNDPTVCDIASVSADGITATLKYGIPGSVTLTGTSKDKDGTVLVCTGSVIVLAGEAATSDMEFPDPPAATIPAAPAPGAPSTSDSATPGASPASPPAPVGDVTAPGGSDTGATTVSTDTAAGSPSSPASSPASPDSTLGAGAPSAAPAPDASAPAQDSGAVSSGTATPS